MIINNSVALPESNLYEMATGFLVLHIIMGLQWPAMR
jgi:hypothetical protein